MKRLIPFTILLSAMLLAVCLAQTARTGFQQKRAEALKLVDKYAQALDSTASFIENYERTGEYRGRYPPNHPYYATHGSKAFRYQVPRRGVYKFKENKGYYHRVYCWGYFDSLHKNVPEDKPIYLLDVYAMDFSYFHRSWACKWDRDVRKTLEPPKGRPGFSHMLGYVDTDERLDEVLRKAKYISVRDETEMVRGSACFVLDAHTRYGQYSLWLDPEHGYHPAKIRKSAKQGEYFHDKIVLRNSIYTSYLDVLEFKKIDDIWVPVEANAGYHRTLGGPAYYHGGDVRYKRNQIILNPDHDKLGSFADPFFGDPSNDPKLVNGMRSEIDMGDHHVEYTWRDGKLIDKDGAEADLNELRVQADRYWEKERAK